MVSNFLIARLTATSSFTRYNTTHIQLASLLQHKHTASLFFFNSFTSPTSSDSESDGNHLKGDTFTVSYLINSCGVSPNLARKLSNRVNLKTPDGPNAVIDLLNNYGFSKTHLAKLVERHPSVLVAKAENTLLPKLKFFHSIGISNGDMPKILIANHTILLRSLEKFLVPRYEILRCVVRDDGEVVRALKNTPFGFTCGDIMNDLVPNIEVLRQSGVPQASISYLMIHSGTVAYWKHSKFVEAVKTAKEIGFNPLRTNFIVAVEMLVTMSKAVWESRFEIYERWGWDREMALRAFRKFPSFMKLTEKSFTKKMSFLVKDMGWPSEDIADYPQVVAYHLEKRIVPRFSVIKILKSKGLIGNNVHFSSIICITEENFLEKFVVNFQKDLPLLPDVYNSLINEQNLMSMALSMSCRQPWIEHVGEKKLKHNGGSCYFRDASMTIEVDPSKLTASLTHHRSTQIQLGFLLQPKSNGTHRSTLIFFNSFTSGTSSYSESDGNHHKGDTFTVSYLVNSCGVSPELAKKLSNRVNLKTPDGPNAVLDLLNNYGFSKTHLAKLVEKHPTVLFANAENTLFPKLKFLRSIGISNTDMPKILIASHHILFRSLEKCLIPRYEILRSVLRDDLEVVRALKNAPFGFTYGDMVNHLVPNIEVLRQCGVPQASISYLMIHSGTLAFRKHSKFVEAVNTAKEIGFNPLRTNFIVAVEMLVTKSKAVWESRFEIYERWGWNRKMALRAFRKFPSVVKLSEETFTKKMSFLVKDMGWPSKDIAEYPLVVGYNLEKRIIPRFLVIKMLKSKGLLENNVHFSSIICVTEENFLEKFVVNFQKDLPLLPDVYRVFEELNSLLLSLIGNLGADPDMEVRAFEIIRIVLGLLS
ncbi:Transcription termination factor MTERF15, mitochondrial, partial [Mucuna pruriens]